MILPWDVSIRRRNYFALVAILQLSLVTGPDIATAQDRNIQQRLQERTPSLPVQTPDFNVGRSSQTTAKRAEHTPLKSRHRQHEKQ
jgi:hypothetical protein